MKKKGIGVISLLVVSLLSSSALALMDAVPEAINNFLMGYESYPDIFSLILFFITFLAVFMLGARRFAAASNMGDKLDQPLKAIAFALAAMGAIGITAWQRSNFYLITESGPFGVLVMILIPLVLLIYAFYTQSAPGTRSGTLPFTISAVIIGLYYLIQEIPGLYEKLSSFHDIFDWLVGISVVVLGIGILMYLMDNVVGPFTGRSWWPGGSPSPGPTTPTTPPAVPPVTPPGRPPATPPGRPPVTPPGRPPATPPGRPPVTPPGRPPATPPGRPPATPPGRPPATPPGRPPATPPGRPPATPPITVPQRSLWERITGKEGDHLVPNTEASVIDELKGALEHLEKVSMKARAVKPFDFKNDKRFAKSFLAYMDLATEKMKKAQELSTGTRKATLRSCRADVGSSINRFQREVVDRSSILSDHSLKQELLNLSQACQNIIQKINQTFFSQTPAVDVTPPAVVTRSSQTSRPTPRVVIRRRPRQVN
jgi:hypothetical protein